MKTITIKWWTNKNDSPQIFLPSFENIRIHKCSTNQKDWFFREAKIEADKAIYVLVKEPAIDNNWKVYIGESNDFNTRYSQHKSKGKIDDYDFLLLITSKSKEENFNKDTLFYIEKELIRKFNASEIFEVNNRNAGISKLNIEPWTKQSLKDKMEIIDIGFKSLGIPLKDDLSTKKIYITSSSSNYKKQYKNIYINVPNHDNKIDGRLEKDNKITILKNQNFTQSARKSERNQVLMKRILKAAMLNESLEVRGNLEEYSIKFLEDITYSSFYTAANLIHGGAPGTNIWKIAKTSKPLLKKDLF